MKRLAIALLVLPSLWAGAGAATLTGLWTLDLDPDFGGAPDAVDCKVQQDGRRLSADCGNGPNISGEVDGHTVTLLVKTGSKNELTARFVGQLDQRESTVTGTWQLTDESGKRRGRFTLRKH